MLRIDVFTLFPEVIEAYCGASILGRSRAQGQAVREGTNQRLRWLGTIVDEAKACAGIGVFGTAIAGTWLASMASESVGFFVDEDRQRTGKTCTRSLGP